MDWEDLIDEQSLAALLPPSHASFALPVKEGLVVFLSGLPASIQQVILGEQLSLPFDATISQRLGCLAKQCPVLHKLGQTLARDKRLAEELRDQLRPLESLEPTTPLATIEDTLAQELGPLRDLGIRLQPPAIAEASVAVVIPFQLTATSGAEAGVFKILKPGIEERLDLELGLLQEVGTHLDTECHRLGIPKLDYRETFDQIRLSLISEVDLVHEQTNLREARQAFSDDEVIVIPRLFDCSSDRVTAMEYIDGVKITDHTLLGREEKSRLAKYVARAQVAHPVFSHAREAMFHGDPHAGNMLYTRDEKVALLDWSLVGRLAARERVAIAQVMVGAITHRGAQIAQTLENLAVRTTTRRDVLRTVVETWLCRLRRGAIPGLTWLVGMLDEAVQTARLSLSKDMVLFRKSLLTLGGVVHDLSDGRVELDDVLLSEFLRRFTQELPFRFLADPTSRAFATHLSNADLVEGAWQMGLLVPRMLLAEMKQNFAIMCPETRLLERPHGYETLAQST